MAAPGPPQSMSHSSSASAPQQPPMPTHSDQITWDGDKMYPSFLVSPSLADLSIPQVQHLHLGLLQKARLSQDCQRTGHRGRHLSRFQTPHQRSARSSVRVRPTLLFLSTCLILSLGGGVCFGCYFRPRTMAPDRRMRCFTIRSFSSTSSLIRLTSSFLAPEPVEITGRSSSPSRCPPVGALSSPERSPRPSIIRLSHQWNRPWRTTSVTLRPPSLWLRQSGCSTQWHTWASSGPSWCTRAAISRRNDRASTARSPATSS
jgi:hypothetical protein